MPVSPHDPPRGGVPAASTDDAVRTAYSERADEYAAALGSLSAMNPLDVQLISDWAAQCPGPIVDAGCGPGHWTHFLQERGAEVEGVDLVPAFVELARTRFPTVSYRVARLDDLGLPDQAAAGILAWYSLIHLEPARVPAVLRELRRCLRDDGTLLLGCFVSERLEPFPHSVATAYSWPVDELTRRLESAGFVVRHTETRPNPARLDRWHSALLAERA